MAAIFVYISLAGVLLLASQAAAMRRVCYYTNWAQYRPGIGKFKPENVDPTLCTHYIYAFAKLIGNQVKAYEWNDESTPWSKGMYDRFMQVKQLNPSAKTLLAIGGWNMGSGAFHAMAHTPSSRREFCDSLIKFLRRLNFDGIDLDWEYPAERGSPAEDKGHYLELLQDINNAFAIEARSSGKPRLLLAAAVAAGKPNIDAAYDVPAMSRLLDMISIMAYDLHGSWETHTGHNSPLYPSCIDKGDDRHLNIDWAARYWVQKGAPKNKLNIGLAVYGRTFTLSTGDNSLGAPTSGPGTAGPYTRERGFLSYQEICEMKQRGGTVVDIPQQRVRYMTLGNQWVGYDDVKSLTEKACYIKSNGYGGVMTWAMDLDDFSGAACSQGAYPLLHAINTELTTPGTAHCVAPQHTCATPVTTPSPTTWPPQTPRPNPVTTASPRTITPTKDFNCYGKVSGFYMSPFSCHEYFICANQMAFRVMCATGLRFNSVTKYCDRPVNVNCNVGTTPAVTTPKPTTAATTQAPITGTLPTMPTVVWIPHCVANVFCQSHRNGLFRQSNNCTQYYQCYEGLGFCRNCNANMVFNERIQACDFPYRVPGC